MSSRIASQLISPKSIAILGRSRLPHQIGGAFLANIRESGFAGEVTVVDSHDPQWKPESANHVLSVEDLPASTDLALLAIPAPNCVTAVEKLLDRGTKAFVIASAGFSECGHDGAVLQAKLRDMAEAGRATLIGPNCIGVRTAKHTSLFTKPGPLLLNRKGKQPHCDFATSSGALSVFVMEAGVSKGLTFGEVFSTGNAAQIGVEDVVQHFDLTYDPTTSSHIKLLYLEKVDNPLRLAHHVASLTKKGCFVVALKSGVSPAGARAAASHTGALATPDTPMDALLEGAGAIPVSTCQDMLDIAAYFALPSEAPDED